MKYLEHMSFSKIYYRLFKWVALAFWWQGLPTPGSILGAHLNLEIMAMVYLHLGICVLRTKDLPKKVQALDYHEGPFMTKRNCFPRQGFAKFEGFFGIPMYMFLISQCKEFLEYRYMSCIVARCLLKRETGVIEYP